MFDSGHFVGGEYVEKFEEEFARFTGAKYAVGLSSGTSALELALKAAGVVPGDEVIVPANSFFATAEAVSNVGAVPVFSDVDAKTFHLDVSGVEKRITKKTRAIIPVHLYGYAMDLTQLEALCARHGLELIEDGAQVVGVGRNGKPAGSSGRLTCFSFYPGKNLGAYGDAGAVTCNDPARIQALRILRDHGSPAKYQHSVIGTNARLDAVQAAILSVKLPYLKAWNTLRVRHAKRYAAALAGSKVVAPGISERRRAQLPSFRGPGGGARCGQEPPAAQWRPERDPLPGAIALDRSLPGAGVSAGGQHAGHGKAGR